MHIITIQETFLEVISDVKAGKVLSESIWIARRHSENEDHQEYYTINVSMKDGKLALSPEDKQPNKISVHRKDSLKFTISIEDDSGEHKYVLIFPKSKLNLELHASKVSASAVLADGSKLLIGTDAGSIFQYDTSKKLLVGEIKNAHLADVSHISVLPSSQVMISVGVDLQTKLWPITGGPVDVPARVFSEQKAQITNLSVIGRGRNFLTASKDGSVFLWECSTAKVVSRFRRIGNLSDPATFLALSKGDPINPEDTVGGDLLFECQDVFVYVGYKSGVIQQYSVAGHYQTGVKFQRASEVTFLEVKGHYLVAGYADGLLRIYNTSSLQTNNNSSGYWDLQLNPNFPIEHASIFGNSKNEQGLSLYVSNGPELLLQVDFDGQTFQTSQLVGAGEMFKIVSINESGKILFIATENEVLQY